MHRSIKNHWSIRHPCHSAVVLDCFVTGYSQLICPVPRIKVEILPASRRRPALRLPATVRPKPSGLHLNPEERQSVRLEPIQRAVSNVEHLRYISAAILLCFLTIPEGHHFFENSFSCCHTCLLATTRWYGAQLHTSDLCCCLNSLHEVPAKRIGPGTANV